MSQNSQGIMASSRAGKVVKSAVVHTMRMEGTLQTGGTVRTAGRINWLRYNKQVGAITYFGVVRNRLNPHHANAD